MSKNPKKKDYWWVLVLVLIFAPGLIGTVAKAALGLLLPLGVIAVVLALALKNDKSKKKSEEERAEEAEKLAQAAAAAEKEKNDKAIKKKLNRLSHSRLFSALAVVCYVLGGFCGLGAAIAAVEAQGVAVAMGDVMAMMVVMLWFLGCGGVLHLISHLRKNRTRDALRYVTLIGDKESCSLAKLSSATSYKIDKIRRDLERMIDDGIFGDQAYIDMSNLCFMRTPDAKPDGVAQQFGDYTRNMSSVGADVEQNASPIFPENSENGEDDALAELTDFSEILGKIRRLDDEIKDEAVSERIRKIESITRNIFEYVADKPEKMPRIRMFMNYYLPTTLKLLESYSRIERVGVAGQNMQEAKDNIEKILDMLTAGFQQQFDQLFQAESLDITSDIEVLEQMMKKDGLRENTDFVIREEEAESILNSFTDSYSDEISDDTEAGGAAAVQKPE